MARQEVRSVKNGTPDTIEMLTPDEGYAAALLDELRQYRARNMHQKADAVIAELERIAPGSTTALKPKERA